MKKTIILIIFVIKDHNQEKHIILILRDKKNKSITSLKNKN